MESSPEFQRFQLLGQKVTSVEESAEKFAQTIQNLERLVSDDSVAKFRDFLLHLEHFVFEMQLALLSLDCCSKGTKLEKLAAARVVLSLYEINNANGHWFKKKVVALCEALKIEMTKIELDKLSSRFPELKYIPKWSNVRNKASGHFDNDVQFVQREIESLDVDKVRSVAAAQISYLVGIVFLIMERWRQRAEDLGVDIEARLK